MRIAYCAFRIVKDKISLKKKVVLVLLILIFLIASLTACSRAEQFFVYGTTLEVTAEGAGANKTIENISDYIESLEGILSPTIEGSDLYKINHANVNEAVKCNDVTMRVFAAAKAVFEASEGAYDPSVYPLVRLWKFSGDTFGIGANSVPTDDQIENAKTLVGLDKCFVADFENSTITKLIDGAMLDFGGVAKGFAVQQSLEQADGKVLVNLGGNIGAIGKAYSVGIANPSRSDRRFNSSYFASFTLENGECVATSGDYERYYEVDGKVYHHIINPFAGRPCDTQGGDGVVSCSVISKDGALSDAVATAVVVLGKEKGEALLEKLSLKGVIIDSSFNAVTTCGLEIKLK